MVVLLEDTSSNGTYLNGLIVSQNIRLVAHILIRIFLYYRSVKENIRKLKMEMKSIFSKKVTKLHKKKK